MGKIGSGLEPAVLARERAKQGAKRRPSLGRKGVGLLETVPLFSGLSKRHLRRIAGLAEEARFPAGRVIVQTGSRGNAFYVTVEGTPRRGGGDHEVQRGGRHGGGRSVHRPVDAGSRKDPRPARAFEEAERLAREGVALLGRTGYLNDRALSLVDLAEVLRLAGKDQESGQALEQALELFERKGNVVSAAKVRELLASRSG